MNMRHLGSILALSVGGVVIAGLACKAIAAPTDWRYGIGGVMDSAHPDPTGIYASWNYDTVPEMDGSFYNNPEAVAYAGLGQSFVASTTRSESTTVLGDTAGVSFGASSAKATASWNITELNDSRFHIIGGATSSCRYDPALGGDPADISSIGAWSFVQFGINFTIPAGDSINKLVLSGTSTITGNVRYELSYTEWAEDGTTVTGGGVLISHPFPTTPAADGTVLTVDIANQIALSAGHRYEIHVESVIDPNEAFAQADRLTHDEQGTFDLTGTFVPEPTAMGLGLAGSTLLLRRKSRCLTQTEVSGR